MLQSKLFGKTLRQGTSTENISGYDFLFRAGFLREYNSHLSAILPLGDRTLTRIKTLAREQMDVFGGQQVQWISDIRPKLNYINRSLSDAKNIHTKHQLDTFDSIDFKPKSESIAALICQHEISSYRNLPLSIYQFQTDCQKTNSPYSSLINLSQALQILSFDMEACDIEKTYQRYLEAFCTILKQCDLPFSITPFSHKDSPVSNHNDLIYLCPFGSNEFIKCPSCGYLEEQITAVSTKLTNGLSPKKTKVLIRTPGITTIDTLCEFLLIETSEVAKTLIFTIDRGNPHDIVTLFAVLRGDTTLNFKKLIGALQLLNINNMESIRLGTENEIRGCGAVPGFASPIGLDSKKIITIVDTLVAKSSNLIAGANQENFHLQNTNYQIDYSADLVFDIHMAESGMSCKYCGESLALEKGFTIGHVEKLLNFDTAGTKCRFLDNTGRDKPILIGYYQLNLFNLLMCIAEEHHDDFGLKWPINVSPYYVHLIKLNSKNEEVDKVTNDLYEALRYANLMPLYDDRDERAGVKFTDADLIGLPYSVLVSSKSLNQGGVELRSRDKTFQQILSPDNAVKVLCEEVNPA